MMWYGTKAHNYTIFGECGRTIQGERSKRGRTVSREILDQIFTSSHQGLSNESDGDQLNS